MMIISMGYIGAIGSWLTFNGLKHASQVYLLGKIIKHGDAIKINTRINSANHLINIADRFKLYQLNNNKITRIKITQNVSTAQLFKSAEQLDKDLHQTEIDFDFDYSKIRAKYTIRWSGIAQPLIFRTENDVFMSDSRDTLYQNIKYHTKIHVWPFELFLGIYILIVFIECIFHEIEYYNKHIKDIKKIRKI